jgi:hypothetical protein
VPVQRDQRDRDVPLGVELAVDATDVGDPEQQRPEGDVEAVEPGQPEEDRSQQPARPVEHLLIDELVVLDELAREEQSAETGRDAQQPPEAVAIAVRQRVVGEVQRDRGEHQHRGVAHDQNIEQVDLAESGVRGRPRACPDGEVVREQGAKRGDLRSDEAEHRPPERSGAPSVGLPRPEVGDEAVVEPAVDAEQRDPDGAEERQRAGGGADE